MNIIADDDIGIGNGVLDEADLWESRQRVLVVGIGAIHVWLSSQ
jgi:hypothetical protein